MMNTGKKALLYAALFLLAAALFPAAVYAEEAENPKVIIEAVGFFTHFPMRQTRRAIEETSVLFGDKVRLTLYDEARAEGQNFLASKGLSGHIPMRLYINGVNTVILDNKTVSFSDFVGYAWTAADLEKVIALALQGSLEAIAVDSPSKKSGSKNYIIIISIAAGIVIIALAGFFLFRPQKKRKVKA